MDQNGSPHDVINFEREAYSVTRYQQKCLFFYLTFLEFLTKIMYFGISTCLNATHYGFGEPEACDQCLAR